MNITGENIVLRAIRPEDCEVLLELINSEEIEKMIGGSSFPVSPEEQRKWIEAQVARRDVLRCMIVPNSNENAAIGTVILSDISYKNGTAQVHIKLNCPGKGYGSDAIKTITEYAFRELRMNCIYAEVLEYNQASRSMFEKCGFKKEGVLRARVFKGGEYVDVVSYSKLKDE